VTYGVYTIRDGRADGNVNVHTTIIARSTECRRSRQGEVSAACVWLGPPAP
jgi:hypothetical protein